MGAEITKQRSLFKFYTERRWANALADGQLLFRGLSYYRDFEDDGVRGDPFEGSATYRPDGGLIMTNHTQGTIQTLVNHSVFSTTDHDGIFVFCVSRSMTDELWNRFNATACVEITSPALFCARVQATVLSPATFIGSQGRQRIGGRVSYYHPSREKAARWAFPDQIALTKHVDFSWQDEFRLVFSRTGALDPYHAKVSLVQGEIAVPDKRDYHPSEILECGSLRDICHIHMR